MKLSVIIPVYHVEATLQRCVESVVGQTFTDLEVILVDDGSPDDCPSLCDNWVQRDSRISVIHKANGGLSDARNAGIDIAQGEVLTFVDSDDYLAPDTYRHAMALLDSDPTCDMVEFPVFWHYGAKEQAVQKFGNAIYDEMGKYWLQGQAYRHCFAWNKLYRRELFSDVRFPKGIVFEDVATLPLLLAKACRVRTIADGLYYYCSNDQGITATAQAPQLTMLLEAHLRVLPHWVDDPYYMHVLNIQLDVTRLTGQPPLLPMRHVSPWSKHYSVSQSLKALAINLLGINRLCKINTLTQRLLKSH